MGNNGDVLEPPIETYRQMIRQSPDDVWYP